MCRGKWNPKLRVLGHHVSQGSSPLSGTCCPLPGSNPRQRKAACYLHGLVGRLIMLLSSKESPEHQCREWPRSQGEGEGERPGVFLLQVSTGEFLQGSLLTDSGPPSWQSSPPWDTGCIEYRLCVANLRARIWQTRPISLSHEKHSVDSIQGVQKTHVRAFAQGNHISSSKFIKCGTLNLESQVPTEMPFLGNNRVLKSLFFSSDI